MTNQMINLIETELLTQMKKDIDNKEVKASDLTTDKPLMVFWSNTNNRSCVDRELGKIYYKYENYIHEQLGNYINQ